MTPTRVSFQKSGIALPKQTKTCQLGVGKTQLDTQRGAGSFTLKVAVKPKQISELLISISFI